MNAKFNPQPGTPSANKEMDMPDAINALVHDGFFLLKGYLPEDYTRYLKRHLMIIQSLHSPLRAARKALECTFGNENLPGRLKRRPLELDSRLAQAGVFGPRIKFVFNEMQRLNSYLMPRVFPDCPTELVLNTGLVNRTSADSSFPRHQDSMGLFGFGFSIQTSRTAWTIETPLGDSIIRKFQTAPGDLVIIRERNPLEANTPEEPPTLGSGFSCFDERGSVVHTGRNLTEQTRVTLNLFSEVRPEV